MDPIVTLSELCNRFRFSRALFYAGIFPKNPPYYQREKTGRLAFPLEKFSKWYDKEFLKNTRCKTPKRRKKRREKKGN